MLSRALSGALSRRVLAAVVATLTALLAVLSGAVPALAADTGAITGTVTVRPAGGGAAVPFEHAFVGAALVLPDGSLGQEDFADASEDGSFTITGLADGQYRLRTMLLPEAPEEFSDLGTEYYDDRWLDNDDVTLVTVNGGTVTLPEPIELQPVGRIVGRVVDEQGQPVAGSLYLTQGSSLAGRNLEVAADGSFDTRSDYYARNLIPGDYRFTFHANSDIGSPVYYYEYYSAVVTGGATTELVIRVRQRPTVTFTLLDTDGSPLAWAPVEFYGRNAGGEWGPPQYGPNVTDEQGRYRFVDEFDEIKVRFSGGPDYQGLGQPEWWQDAATFEEATAITFPPGVVLDRSYTVQLDRPAITAGAPSVVGKARVGQTLQARAGSWAPAGVQLTYQWLADGRPVAGATKSTYAPTNAVAGRRITVRVTGSLPGADPVVRTSAATAAVRGQLRTARPVVAGKPRVGARLTARPGKWGPRPVTLRYQWQRDGRPVRGATARRYVVRKADRGHRISVRVIGRKPSYAAAAAVSRATPKVRR